VAQGVSPEFKSQYCKKKKRKKGRNEERNGVLRISSFDLAF
jgi:hypothetical protein